MLGAALAVVEWKANVGIYRNDRPHDMDTVLVSASTGDFSRRRKETPPLEDPHVTAVWVDDMPLSLEPGNLYISVKHRLTEHLCACGCGTEVSLPLSRSEWRIEYDGEFVSISPSIGNWRLPCRSHYIIENGTHALGPCLTQKEIQTGRARDAKPRRPISQGDADRRVGGAVSTTGSGDQARILDKEIPHPIPLGIRCSGQEPLQRSANSTHYFQALDVWACRLASLNCVTDRKMREISSSSPISTLAKPP